MIHFLVGTKGQLIKTAPVMGRLCHRGIPYRYVDLGQHARTSRRLRRIFDLGEPDVSLGPGGRACGSDIVSIRVALRWGAIMLGRAMGPRRRLLDEVFGGHGGVAVIHGDTLSTLLGLLLARRAGLEVLHLEAGLRSHHLLHPFPEEIFRLVCMRYADHLMAPADWAHENLVAMGYSGKAWRVPGNTGAEALHHVLAGPPAAAARQADEEIDDSATATPFVLVSIHRFETITRRKRCRDLVAFLADLAERVPVCFVLHPPTERRLARYGLLSVLRHSRVKLVPLMSYPEFCRLLQAAELVVTDGGSVQEECSYLGKPCLLYRKRTERRDGLGENAFLSELNPGALDWFVREYRRYRRPPARPGHRASDAIIDWLLASVHAGEAAAGAAGGAASRTRAG